MVVKAADGAPCAARSSCTSVGDRPFSDNSSRIIRLYAALGARLVGTVTDETGLPVAGVVVVAVPDVEHWKNSQRFQSETADQYGRFVNPSIAPGGFQEFSWESVASQACEDP